MEIRVSVEFGTYVVGHELKSPSPIVHVKVYIPEPGIAVSCTAAPFGLGHVVVEMDVHLLLGELSCDGIVHLHPRQLSVSQHSTHLDTPVT